MPGVRGGGAPCAVGTDRRVWMWGCGGGVRGDTRTQLEDVVPAAVKMRSE